jgi:predicted O-methyltransferase YrrM
MLDLRPYLRRPISTLSSIAADPVEAWIRFREQFAADRDERVTPDTYTIEADWEQRLHRRLEIASPDEINAEFWQLWPVVIKELHEKGVEAGPCSFKGWNDGDTAFVRAIWCTARHLRPSNVVETGVAHGVTSRFILEALERNGKGRLWSIDRAPIEAEWQSQIGIAVAERLKHRWTYIRGSSRARLPRLLSKLGEIDLFVHDSLHSERNVRFEMDRAWAALRTGGAIVVDDIDVNQGFRNFTQNVPAYTSIVCEAEPLHPDLRRFNQKGLFGIVLKTPSIEEPRAVPKPPRPYTGEKPSSRAKGA